MATLTQSQIYAIAATAGLPNPKLMAAIAMAESSGRTDVVNSIGAVGLWQINQPVHVKAHPTWTVAWLKNPVNNASAAKVILSRQGLGAWEGYTNGAYKKYYGGTTQADFPVPDIPGLPPLEDIYPALPNIPGIPGLPGSSGMGIMDTLELFGKASMWIADTRNWVRIAYVMGGAVITLVGLNMMTRADLFKYIPMGKVANLAKGAAK